VFLPEFSRAPCRRPAMAVGKSGRASSALPTLARRSVGALATLGSGPRRTAAMGQPEMRVATPHSFTGRMCAASRWEESSRPDSLFVDHLARKLAGSEGMAAPMGSWIMVPRTRFGDDFLRAHYERGCRQLVLLGAGFDARAYRMAGLEELRVFEVDQRTTFDVKEPLLVGEPLAVAGRAVVATEFTEKGRWRADLVAAGFDPAVPTVWLLEGLLMYLGLEDAKALMMEVGALSAKGSAVFHDACSAHYLRSNIVVGGARFIGGHDDYAGLWGEYAGFHRHARVRDFSSIQVDRRNRRVVVDRRVPDATPEACRGRAVVLFVEAEK